MLLKPTLADINALGGAWRQHPRYQGCVGHWLLGEGSGVLCYDVSGYGNTGTILNTTLPLWGYGASGSAARFNGGSVNEDEENYVEIPSAPQLLLPNDLTLLCRARIDSTAPAFNTTLVFKGAFDAEDYALYVEDDGDIVFEYFFDDYYQHVFTVVGGFSVGTTYTYAVTVQGDTVQAFRDGVPQGSAQTKDFALVPTSSPLQFGSDGPEFPQRCLGLVEEVRIYPRALSLGDIASWHAAPWLEFVPLRVGGKASAVVSDMFPSWLSVAGRLPVERPIWVGIEY